MDYEKKYKKSLERAKKELNTCGSQDCDAAKQIFRLFPELQESEDERIRKALVRFHKSTIDVDGIKGEDIIAWLEKQGEKKVSVDDFKAKDWYVSKVDGKIRNIYYSVDKIEPKFKVGDWIITKDKNVHKDYSICKIVEIENNRYHLENGDYLDIDTLEQYDYRLWTIQDAKDGDVLACGDKVTDCPFIFHNLTEEQNPRSYCGINTSGDFQYNDENGGFWCKSDEVRPATKEQRDLLFQKMKEDGYEWDAEKKELKKIEDEIEIPFGAKDSELQEVTYYIPKGFHAEIDDDKVVIKKGKKPAEWSEDDENILNAITYTVKNSGYKHCIGVSNKIMVDWLKSLEDRVQPKQEWNEDDERITTALMEGFRYHQLFNPKFGEVPNAEIISWIKSLKERLS